jgi:CxxC-x17-CxxC domain-containing protein
LADEDKAADPKAQAEDTGATGTQDRFGRTLYPATCAGCGKQTEVPFKPSGDRPVYCQDCYRQRREERRPRSRSF